MLGTAHPRSRGENGQPIVDLIITVGSSPLTRGKLVQGTQAVEAEGLIPAHAGKTFARSIRSTSLRAHPRSRGENQGRSLMFPKRVGSSPLTRGKRCGHGVSFLWLRLIPAHAGKTRSVVDCKR